MRQLKGDSLLDFPNEYTVIDIETTGLDPQKDAIIEVAAIRIRDSAIVDTYASLINPNMEITPYIMSLTGLTNEQLSKAPAPCGVLLDLYNFIGQDIVVGHNVNFDINFLYDNFDKYLNNPFSNDYIDTLRLSKRYVRNISSHSLVALSDYFQIQPSTFHRALADCYTTDALFKKLKEQAQSLSDAENDLLSSLTFSEDNPFYNKRIAVKGLPQLYSFSFMKSVAEKCHAKLSDVFYQSCDYVIFSKFTYSRYEKGLYSEKFEKANALKEAGTLTIISEIDFCKILNIPIPATHKVSLSAKDISTTNSVFDETHPLYGKMCVFTGTLEKLQRKDAMQIVVDFGGLVGDSVTKKTNYLILGNNDYCPLIKDGKSSKQKKAETLKLTGQDIEIISENVFYDMIEE